MEGIIYMYVSPSGKKYVGQTIREKKRISQHAHMVPPTTIFHCAVKKYGIENFDYVVLHRDIKTIEELNRLESIEIIKNNSIHPHGYNLEGGGGNKGEKSEYTRNKMREAQLGRLPASTETRLKISTALKGVKKSQEHARKVGLAVKGQKRNQEQINRLRAAKEKDRIKVVCIETGEAYDSVISAAAASGASRGCISLAINGKRITAGGFHWIKSSIANDESISKIVSKKSRNDTIRRSVVCIETGVVYPSSARAKVETGIHGISRCCKIPGYKAGGYSWRYEN